MAEDPVDAAERRAVMADMGRRVARLAYPTCGDQRAPATPQLVPGQNYVARVVNFAAVEPYSGTVTFGGPEPFQPAKTESWTLTHKRRDGTALSSQTVTIGRGQRQTPDLSACA